MTTISVMENQKFIEKSQLRRKHKSLKKTHYPRVMPTEKEFVLNN